MPAYKKRQTFSAPPAEIIGRKNANKQFAQYQFPSDLNAYQFLMNFKEYKFVSDRGDGELETIELKDSIALPLPEQINQAYGIDIKQQSLGPIVEAGVRAISGEGLDGALGIFGNPDAAANEFGDTIAAMASSGGVQSGIAAGINAQKENKSNGKAPNNAKGGASSGPGAAKPKVSPLKRGAAAMLKSILPEPVVSGLEASFGALYNPALAAVFKGVPLRSHNFSWKLVPRNEEESRTLNEIVRKIRKAIHPSLSGIFENGALMQTYPDIVECALVIPDNDQNIFYKPALVTSFNVDHSKERLAFFAGSGNPVVYTINMSMTELDVITKEDFELLEKPISQDEKGST
jgi:hypothetical protein